MFVDAAASLSVTPIAALRLLHGERWDRERGMDRYAPGVVPGVDISSLNLHTVRETALGAFLDLCDGNVERAVTALRNVLALQYPLSPWPWSGTFPVSAEQPEPPGVDAVEWVHYDPNWRQFLGCILAVCAIEHGPVLPGDVTDAIASALHRCVEGEPDDRIARWYTNPNLMHAWLQGHVAEATGDGDLESAAEARVAMIKERFDRFGDVDEYNSPTYDGIDLLAIGLWATNPPTGAFADAAATMLARLGDRISKLYHPRFGATCGPYIRAYGIDPKGYVSLSGLLLSVCGEPAERVLPSRLVADTVHVHDLYFLPLMQHVAPVLRPHVRPLAVTTDRHHVQRFGRIIAESLLLPDLAVGWESGRRQDFSLDQYVPFSAHVDIDGAASEFGLMVPGETAWVDCRRVDDTSGRSLEFVVDAEGRDDTVGLRLITGPAPLLRSDRLAIGPIAVRFDTTPDEVDCHQTPIGHETLVRWDRRRISARISLTKP